MGVGPAETVTTGAEGTPDPTGPVGGALSTCCMGGGRTPGGSIMPGKGWAYCCMGGGPGRKGLGGS